MKYFTFKLWSHFLLFQLLELKLILPYFSEKEGDIRYYSNKDKLDELLASYFNPTIPADQQVQTLT